MRTTNTQEVRPTSSNRQKRLVMEYEQRPIIKTINNRLRSMTEDFDHRLKDLHSETRICAPAHLLEVVAACSSLGGKMFKKSDSRGYR